MNDNNLAPKDEKLFKFFVKAFNQVFDQVLEPALSGMENEISGGIKVIKVDVEKLKVGQDRMERKMDLITDKYFDHDEAIKNHEKRIKKFEITRIAA